MSIYLSNFEENNLSMKEILKLFLQGMRNPIMFLFVTVLCVYVGYALTHIHRDNPSQAKKDTTHVVIYDTIPYHVPVPRDSVVKRYVTATLPKGGITPSDSAHNSALSVDSIEADSCTVLLPISQYTFKDSTYKALVSGYGVTLDYIETYNKTVYIREKPKKWGFGVQVGVGWNGKVEPYVGVGVSYDLFRW